MRLLHKGQQSNFRVERPSDDDILEMCHGRALGPEHVQLYGQLKPAFKQVIDQLLFFTVETNEKDKTSTWRFFSRKAAPQDTDDCNTLSSCYLALSSSVHHQFGGTCYAHAIATAVRATENRIVGRVPMSHAEIVRQIVAKHGRDGANTEEVLKEECGKRRLGFCRIDVEDMIEVMQANRSLVVTFHFSEDVWHAFSSFFRQNPSGVLTREAIDQCQPNYSLPSSGRRSHSVHARAALSSGHSLH